MKQNKVLHFIKKNVSYVVVALCILAVGLSLVFVLLSQAETDNVSIEAPVYTGETVAPEVPAKPTLTPEEVIEEKTVSFIMPVNDPVSIEHYSDAMVYNGTLKRFSSHQATDFFAAAGTPVYAVYDGVVESVENSLLTGITITVNHGNGLITVYNSLESIDDIAVNSVVAQGDVIGYVSNTNRQENFEGAHLHFVVKENGEIINASKYLDFDLK